MSMSYLARDIAARLHHRGSFIAPEHSDVAADLREIASVNLDQTRASFDLWRREILSSYGMSDCVPTIEKPFAYANGVAIIPIHGLLVNRLSWSYSFATGYNFIRSQRMAALADPDVKLIAYDVNSSGGLASGCAELAREMYDSRDEKPSIAVIDARGYSAAYFLASAADRIVVTPSGGVGSIGCMSMHVDYSGMVEADGLKITFVFAGAEKVDGNPYQSLSPRAKATIQRDVDYHYGLFIEAVARHRGMSEDGIRATEAACYLPPEALDIGLIDAVETPAEAVATYFNEITSDAEAGDDEMTQATGQDRTAAPALVATAPVQPTFTQADIDAAATRAATAALAADRARQSGIRNSEEAKGRTGLANHLANDTELSVEAAIGILAAASKEPEVTAGAAQLSPFGTAMDTTRNPNLAADAGNTGAVGGEADTAEARASRILGAYSMASGVVIDIKPGARAAA